MPLSVSADWACGHALRVPARPVHSRAAKLGGLFERATIITGLPGSQSCPYEPSSVRSPPAVRDHQRPALGPTFTRSARARNAADPDRFSYRADPCVGHRVCGLLFPPYLHRPVMASGPVKRVQVSVAGFGAREFSPCPLMAAGSG